MAEYTAVPFMPTPERAEVISKIMRSTAEYDTIFTDYEKGGEDRLACVARTLGAPNSIVWEVWRNDDESEVVGILYLTDVKPGIDAKAHYVFFDGKLADKTALLEEMIEWVFTDHDRWPALRRLTIEIPDFAKALTRHAQKQLGFDGDFEHDGFTVEGVKRKALLWRGDYRDVLVLGRLR